MWSWRSRPMKATAGLQEAREQDASVWFLVEYDARPDVAGAIAAAFASYPGLMLVCSLDATGSTTRLTTYWATKPDFEASQQPLEEATGSKPSRAGFVRQLCLGSRPWWKRPSRWVAGAIALFALADGLLNHAPLLFEAPAVFADLGGPSTRSEIAKTPLALNLRVANGGMHMAASVTLDAVTVNNLGGRHESRRVRYPEPSTAVPPSGSAELPLMIEGLDAGSYMLMAQLHAKVGWLRSTRSYVAQRPLEVFSERPRVQQPLRIVPMAGRPTQASLRSTTLVGRAAPGGLECVAVFKHVSNLNIDAIAGGTRDGGVARSSDSDTMALRWYTVPLAPFTKHDVELWLSSNAPIDWGSLANSVVLTCSEHTTAEETRR